MNEEIVKKAKECKSAEELMEFFEKNNVNCDKQQAEEIFAKLNPAEGEIGDDELDSVSGGFWIFDKLFPGIYSNDSNELVDGLDKKI